MIGLLAALALAMSAAQSLPVDDCRDDRGTDRCAAEAQERVRTLFGVQPIEAHRDAGDQIYRAFYVDGYGRDVVAISFLRRPGHDPELLVHLPRWEGQARPEPLRAMVPQNVWDDVARRSAHFDRELVSRFPRAESESTLTEDDEVITLCLHSWVYTIESVEDSNAPSPQPVIRRRTEDACNGGLTGAFARELDRAAVSLLPPCARLDPAQHRNAATLLAACGWLGGDRMAAAEVRNRAHELRWVENVHDVSLLARLFHSDSVIDWNGERIAGFGGTERARFWVQKAMENEARTLFFDEIQGENARRVRLTGFFERWPDGPNDSELLERAPVEMIWTRRSSRDDAFFIESATVGPFAPVETR